MAVTLEVIHCIETMPDDAIIMSDDFDHLCAKPSTIYNALSLLVRKGLLSRPTQGVYAKLSRIPPSVEEIVNRKARRFCRSLRAKESSPDLNRSVAQYQYWTSGRTTSFKLLKAKTPYATVLLQEKCRATADKKRSKTREISARSCVTISENGRACAVNKAATAVPHRSDLLQSSGRGRRWCLVWHLPSEVVESLQNCLTLLQKGETASIYPGSQLRLSMEQKLLLRRNALPVFADKSPNCCGQTICFRSLKHTRVLQPSTSRRYQEPLENLVVNLKPDNWPIQIVRLSDSS